ncbi:hypothetical protein KIPB_003949 [Kipferlia bialata]|uniref:Uncharacterized protein n=1 Tax=Kipferlia bialata TaxID=797122 RepID=A0A9K3GHQ2_9EUKA|nr:hypothetical protein KIPB_003949 [Kipferlia bialata]|eukprot:g3949.t1
MMRRSCLKASNVKYDEEELFVGEHLKSIERGDYDHEVHMLVVMHSASMLWHLALGKDPVIHLTQEEYDYLVDAQEDTVTSATLQKFRTR